MEAASAAAAASLLGDQAAVQAAAAAAQAIDDHGQDSDWYEIVGEYIDSRCLVSTDPKVGEEGEQQQLKPEQWRDVMAAVDRTVTAADPPLPYPPPTTLGLLPNCIVQAVKAQLLEIHLKDDGYGSLDSEEGGEGEGAEIWLE
jgi:hypothetical protein